MGSKYGPRLFDHIESHKDAVYVLQSELEAVVPQHTHTQGHILYVMQGVATLNAGHNEYYIPNGYFVWIPPKISHRISFEEKKIKILNIYYPVKYSAVPFYENVGVYPIPSLLFHTFEQVEGKTATYRVEDWQHELLVTLIDIIPHIVNQNRAQLRMPVSDNPAVLKILKVIHKKYKSELTATMVADEVGMSVRTLSRHLRSELDLSFIEYLRKYRMVMAIKQMVKGDETITNIAYSVGYESLTAFSNTFYKVTGCRPSQFLKTEEDEHLSEMSKNMSNYNK